MDKQSWKHGKEITSEEEYNEQTSALAEELQRLYTRPKWLRLPRSI